MAELTPAQVSQFLVAIDDFYSQGDESKLHTLFKIFDRDGNGKIDSRELNTVMSSVSHQQLTDGDVQAMIAEADTNQDGVIDISEFIANMRSQRG